MNAAEVRATQDIARLKDQSAAWQDKFAICSSDLNERKEDYEMLLDERNELMQEVLNSREKLRRIYEKEPALDPSKEQTLIANIKLAPPTQRDARLGKRLHESGKI